MPKVKFIPQNVEFEIGTTESVLLLAQKNDVHIQSICKGIPSCAECRVRIVEGEHHVIPPSSKEIELIGTAHYIDHSRLSCQLRCYGDVIIDLTEQVEKENKVSKKVRGNSRRDPKESKAILGSIIEEYKEDDDKQFVKEFVPSMRSDEDGFYEDLKKTGAGPNRNHSNQKNNNRNNQNQNRGPQAQGRNNQGHIQNRNRNNPNPNKEGNGPAQGRDNPNRQPQQAARQPGGGGSQRPQQNAGWNKEFVPKNKLEKKD